jgi:hypothetical protein
MELTNNIYGSFKNSYGQVIDVIGKTEEGVQAAINSCVDTERPCYWCGKPDPSDAELCPCWKDPETWKNAKFH